MVGLGAGVLLVANPELPDPNFDRTVVLLLTHGDDGAAGVVLNRPSTLDAGERFARWGGLLSWQEVIFQGGPVNRSGVIGLARRAAGVTGALPDDLLTEVLPGVGVLDLDAPSEDADRLLGALRLYAGYAGWGPGQLEAEIDAGGWWVVQARPDDVWTPSPETLWRTVLRRQGGALAIVSSYTAHPERN